MAHGAVILVLLARFRQSFRRGRDGVFLCGILRRHLGFRGGGFILSEVWFGAENSEQQHCTCDEDCPTHSILPTGREPPKERTRLDFEGILRPREVEGKGYKRTKPGVGVDLLCYPATFLFAALAAVFPAFSLGWARSNRALAERRQNPHGNGWTLARASAPHRLPAE